MFSSIFYMLNLMVLQWLAVLFKPILGLDIMNFSSCRNNWGGGGTAKRYVCPNIKPPPPPPPRIDASASNDAQNTFNERSENVGNMIWSVMVL